MNIIFTVNEYNTFNIKESSHFNVLTYCYILLIVFCDNTLLEHSADILFTWDWKCVYLKHCIIILSNNTHNFLGQSRPGNGTVQFYNNKTNTTSSSAKEGVVQVYLNNTWGNICRDDDFSQTEADTICYQMGYTGASRYDSASRST